MEAICYETTAEGALVLGDEIQDARGPSNETNLGLLPLDVE